MAAAIITHCGFNLPLPFTVLCAQIDNTGKVISGDKVPPHVYVTEKEAKKAELEETALMREEQEIRVSLHWV